MSEEIVIIEVKPKIFDINTFDCEPGTFSVRTNFERELYEVNQPISYKPKFLAIRDPDTCQVELLYTHLFISFYTLGFASAPAALSTPK